MKVSEADEFQVKFRRLEVALSAIVDALVWIDGEGRVQWCNAPFRRLVERHEAEVQGAKLIDLLPLEDQGNGLRPEAHPVHRAMNGQSNAVGSYEFRKAGQRRVLEIMAARVHFSPQEMSTVVAIRDITERKQAEQTERKLAAAAAAAAQEAKRRAAELDKAYQDLKNAHAMLVQAEKMVAVGQLASGIAHEVRNPLGIILQGVNYLEGEITPEHQQAFDALQMVKEAVKRSDKIVRDLLNFSRQTPLEPSPCNMNAVIATALDLVKKQLALNNITVKEVLADDLPLAVLDERQMTQVLINVIVNAIHAMPQGGELILRTSTKALTGITAEVGRRASDLFRPGEVALICEVEDTGVGIPKELLSKVFDPFFTTKPVGQGTGLGLSITRSIVEKHRGLITLTSEEGRGTTVTIMLPVAPKEAHGV